MVTIIKLKNFHLIEINIFKSNTIILIKKYFDENMLIGCSIQISTKGRVNSKQVIAKSSCPNFSVKNLSIHIAKKTKFSPCTNHPVRCEICNKCFWSYNMETHYKAEHVHLPISKCFFPR